MKDLMRDLQIFLDEITTEVGRQRECWCILEQDGDYYMSQWQSQAFKGKTIRLGSTDNIEDCKETIEFYFIL